MKCLKVNEFGDVLVAKTKRGKKVVVKRVDTSTVKKEFYMNEAAASKLFHPNICKVNKIFEENSSVYMEMEYIEGCDLYDFMSDRDFKPLKESEAKNIFKQLMKAVLYCHSKGIVHRDLKLENVMLCKNGKVKLIDFGLCLEASCDTLSNSWCGSTDYACPEIIHRKPYSACKADVWSLGTILFALVFAELPFTFEERAERIKLGLPHKNVEFPKKIEVSASLKDLIFRMLSIEPRFRLTLEEVTIHQWLTKSTSILPSIRNSLPLEMDPHRSCQYASPKKLYKFFTMTRASNREEEEEEKRSSLPSRSAKKNLSKLFS